MTFVDEPVLQPVALGFQTGLIRCSAGIRGFDVATIDLPQAASLVADLATGALRQRERQWPAPALQFLSEVITVGVCSRMHYREDTLHREDVAEFFPWFERIINSLAHF
jgi:hypothetical protein